MRILVVAHKPPYPPVDGGTLATLNLCLGLAKAGNNVTVLTLSTPKHPGSMEPGCLGVLRVNTVTLLPALANPKHKFRVANVPPSTGG